MLPLAFGTPPANGGLVYLIIQYTNVCFWFTTTPEPFGKGSAAPTPGGGENFFIVPHAGEYFLRYNRTLTF
jgi:hypothetical protein